MFGALGDCFTYQGLYCRGIHLYMYNMYLYWYNKIAHFFFINIEILYLTFVLQRMFSMDKILDW